jgi:hypothetical protein
MRIVEWSGHLVGDAPASQARAAMPVRSELLGPEAGDADQSHLRSRLLDPLAARRARQLAHADDLRSAGGGATSNDVRTARKAGGHRAAIDLNGPLGDDWVMCRGYQNASGPIGQLLLGPRGLVAMTSYFLDAEVHCRGEKWHAERPGRSREANAREPKARELSLNDPDGRSPSTQLNQASDTLEKFLHAAGVQLSIERVVLLNHPKAWEGEWHRPSVHIFRSTFDLTTWLNKLPKVLDRGQKKQIENLISGGDHQHPSREA